MYRLTKNQDQLVDDFLNEKDYKLNFYRAPYRQYLKNYWFDFFKLVFVSKAVNKELKKDVNLTRNTLIRVNTHTPINKFENSNHVYELEKLISKLKKKI